MIRAATVAMALIAASALAEPVMTLEACEAGWSAFTDLSEMPEYLRISGHIVTPDGWCRMDKTTATLKKNDYEVLHWRAVGVLGAIEKNVPPQSLEAIFEGVLYPSAINPTLPNTSNPGPGTMRLAIFHDPLTQILSLTEASADFGPMGRFNLTGQGSGFDFSSDVAMQMAVGGMRLNAASFKADLTAPLAQVLFSSSIPWVGKSIELPELLAMVPETSLAAQDRAALSRFLAALPDATGKLEVSAISENGFGAVQLGSGAWWYSGPDSLTKAIELWLSGITIQASWTPAV